MKQHILLAIGLLIVNCAFAQKYKTVYESIKYMNENDAYQTLENFSRAHNNSHPASLYKMYTILEHRISTYDPFLQEKVIYQNIKNMLIYLNLAQINMSEKVARQDGIYFDSIVASDPKKGPTFQEITDDLNNKKEKLQKFNQYFEQNRKTLYIIANKYNKCIELFNDINVRNSKLKDLYFLADDDLRQQLNELRTNFDSTIYYLNALQKSLAEYPMLNYKFKYKLNPITIYRMHGLTQANLLAPEIQLWDFNLWIDTFYKTINGDVAYLHKTAEELDSQHAKYVESLSRGDTNGIPANYQIPRQVLNNIYKYDYASLAGALLTFQESQVQYAQQLVSYGNDTSLMSFGMSRPSSSHFSLAVEQRHRSDSLLKAMTDAISAEQIRKYSDLLAKRHGGETGLKKYAESQKGQNRQLFDNALSSFSKQLIQEGMDNGQNDSAIVYDKNVIYSKKTFPTEISSNGYFVQGKDLTANGDILISGTYADKSGAHLGFVACIDTASNVKWLKQLKQGEGKRSCQLVKAVNDEAVTILTVASKSGTVKNFIYLLDKTGNIKQSAELSGQGNPCSLMIDDINNTYFAVFDGRTDFSRSMTEKIIKVCLLDQNFKTVWEKQQIVNGYICNVLKSNNVYYICGAFEKILSLENEEYNLGDKSGIFVYSIDANGEWLTGEQYEYSKSVYPLWVSKIDNSRFEVVSVSDTEDQSAYIQYSFGGDELYNSLEE